MNNDIVKQALSAFHEHEPTINRFEALCFEIDDIPALDAIRVIVQDTSPGAGRIIIECFGEAWAAYWPAMGSRSVAEFFIQCDNYYLLNNLKRAGVRVNRRKDDYLLRVIVAVRDALRRIAKR